MSGIHRKKKFFPVMAAVFLAGAMITLSSYRANAVVDIEASRSIEASCSEEESIKESLLALLESSPEEGLEALTELPIDEPVSSEQVEESGLEAEIQEMPERSQDAGSAAVAAEASGSEAESSETLETTEDRGAEGLAPSGESLDDTGTAPQDAEEAGGPEESSGSDSPGGQEESRGLEKSSGSEADPPGETSAECTEPPGTEPGTSSEGNSEGVSGVQSTEEGKGLDDSTSPSEADPASDRNPVSSEDETGGESNPGEEDDSRLESLSAEESSADSLEGMVEENSSEAAEELGGAPEFLVEIPARVILNEGRSFTIRTVPARPISGGRIVVTVEGSQAPDGDSFALYCGESYWGFHLQIGEALVTPGRNQVELAPEEPSCQAKVIPTGGSLCAGTYSGKLNFTVTFQPDAE